VKDYSKQPDKPGKYLHGKIFFLLYRLHVRRQPEMFMLTGGEYLSCIEENVKLVDTIERGTRETKASNSYEHGRF